MSDERHGAITFKNNPVTLIGPELRVGDKAPAFTLAANDLSDVTLDDSSGKVRIVSVALSIDTSVCDAQGRRFNEAAGALGDDVAILTVTMDLPFAQSRWCGAAGIDQIQVLSDYKTHSFGTAWGVRIKEVGLLARAAFVVDKDDNVAYAQVVPEATDEPDYDKVIEAAKATV